MRRPAPAAALPWSHQALGVDSSRGREKQRPKACDDWAERGERSIGWCASIGGRRSEFYAAALDQLRLLAPGLPRRHSRKLLRSLSDDHVASAALSLLMEATWGFRVSPEKLGEIGSIRRLVRLLRWHAIAPELIRVLGGPGNSPLFVIHSMNGTVGFLDTDEESSLRALRRPVYGLIPPAERHRLKSHNLHTRQATIETLSSLYAQAIRATAARPPYLLAGYCIGGWIALEVARLLELDGERVEIVVLAETPFPEPGAEGLSLDQLIEAQLEEIAPLLKMAAGVRCGAVLAAAAKARAFTRARVQWSCARYRPRPINAPVHLLRSERDSVVTSDDTASEQWRSVNQPVQVRTLPNTSHSIFRGPEMARVLEGLIPAAPSQGRKWRL